MRRLAALLILSAISALAACAPAMDHVAEPDVGVQLFQRPWTAIADDCEKTLGPAGFAWVLTSPAQEHLAGEQWWTSYQPVSYELESRLGTAAEFAEMVTRCDAAGVQIIADAVINHMAGVDAGVGTAGTVFTHFDYPDLYAPEDFHHCGLTAQDDIEDYTSREQVQTCELVNLADLDTGSTSVREKILGYLRGLLDLGVAGFRIDAAKHMSATDVQAIVDGLPAETIILSEVIRGSAAEPVQPEEYLSSGSVFEFQYARDLGPGVAAGVITDPALDDERPLHVPSDAAIVFVDNHDTERGDAALTYRDGARYLLANVLMLADDFGTPVVFSGYAFDERDAGPRTDAAGRVAAPSCGGVTGPRAEYAAGDAVCTEHWTAIVGMLDWRAAVADAPRLPGMASGSVYGFEREGRGLVLVNPSASAERATVPVGLPNGTYCDVISGGAGSPESGCAGTTVDVAGGRATVEVPADGAIGIHVGALPPP